MQVMTIDSLVSALDKALILFFWFALLAKIINILPAFTSSPYVRLVVLFNLAIRSANALLKLDARFASGAPRELSWPDEVVVITGGAGGLGRLIAKAYGERGVKVAVLDIKAEGGDDAMSVCALGPKVRYYKCDVGYRGNVEAVRSRIEEHVCWKS